MSELSPLRSFRRSLGYVLSGRIHFPKGRIGEVVRMDGDLDWVIFRQVVIGKNGEQPEKPGAIFRPLFHVANMNLQQNRRFSWLPVPFFVGLPGFRTKLWLHNEESGDSCGLYAWNTPQDAASYGASFAADFMRRRSVPESLSFRVITPQDDDFDFYASILLKGAL